MQSTEQKIEVFPGIYVGDLVVSLRNRFDHRKEGDIIEVQRTSKKDCLYYRSGKSSRYGEVCTTEFETFRKATPEEIEWYKSAKKELHIHPNIKDMPQIKNHYQIY